MFDQFRPISAKLRRISIIIQQISTSLYISTKSEEITNNSNLTSFNQFRSIFDDLSTNFVEISAKSFVNQQIATVFQQISAKFHQISINFDQFRQNFDKSRNWIEIPSKILDIFLNTGGRDQWRQDMDGPFGCSKMALCEGKMIQKGFTRGPFGTLLGPLFIKTVSFSGLLQLKRARLRPFFGSFSLK